MPREEGGPRSNEENIGTNPTLGEYMRQRRQELGLSRSSVGSVSDISTAYIGKIERGEIKDPGFSRVCRVAKALELDIGELAKRFGESERGRAIRDKIRYIHKENPDLPLISAIESGPGLDAIFDQMNRVELRGYLGLLKILIPKEG